MRQATFVPSWTLETRELLQLVYGPCLPACAAGFPYSTDLAMRFEAAGQPQSKSMYGGVPSLSLVHIGSRPTGGAGPPQQTATPVARDDMMIRLKIASKLDGQRHPAAAVSIQSTHPPSRRHKAGNRGEGSPRAGLPVVDARSTPGHQATKNFIIETVRCPKRSYGGMLRRRAHLLCALAVEHALLVQSLGHVVKRHDLKKTNTIVQGVERTNLCRDANKHDMMRLSD